MTVTTPEEFEKMVRGLRDIVYGPCSDNNWEACKENWLKYPAVDWLAATAKRIEQSEK